jgi:hypothetical protein
MTCPVDNAVSVSSDQASRQRPSPKTDADKRLLSYQPEAAPLIILHITLKVPGIIPAKISPEYTGKWRYGGISRKKRYLPVSELSATDASMMSWSKRNQTQMPE